MSDRTELRTASEEDIDVCCDLFFASYNDLHRRHGFEEEDPDERAWLEEALGHLIETDPSGTLLAVQDGEPVAFASSYRRETYWFLSFLFVDPARQAEGIGRRMLEAVFPPSGGGDPAARALVVESFQPISIALYARYTITPRAIQFRLGGIRDPGRLPGLPPAVDVGEVTRTTLPELAALDRRVLGYARDVDHAWWMSETPGFAYRRDGELVGYGYLDVDGIGPALGADESTLTVVVADLLRRSEDPQAVTLGVYANAGELFGALLGGGARIEPLRYQYLYCSTGDPLPPSYVPHAPFMP